MKKNYAYYPHEKKKLVNDGEIGLGIWLVFGTINYRKRKNYIP